MAREETSSQLPDSGLPTASATTASDGGGDGVGGGGEQATSAPNGATNRRVAGIRIDGLRVS
jgi:hypothetical protein